MESEDLQWACCIEAVVFSRLATQCEEGIRRGEDDFIDGWSRLARWPLFSFRRGYPIEAMMNQRNVSHIHESCVHLSHLS